MKHCNHPECCKYYCNIESDAEFQNENQKKLEPFPERFWKDGRFVHEKTSLFYCGISLHLHPDGTYQLEDTTGG